MFGQLPIEGLVEENSLAIQKKVGWGQWVYSSYLNVFQNQRLDFCIQCILRCHWKSDLPVTPMTASQDDYYDVFTAKRKFPVYLVLPLPVFDSNVYILRKVHNW